MEFTSFVAWKISHFLLAQSPRYRVLCGMIAREPSDGCLYVARSCGLLRSISRVFSKPRFPIYFQVLCESQVTAAYILLSSACFRRSHGGISTGSVFQSFLINTHSSVSSHNLCISRTINAGNSTTYSICTLHLPSLPSFQHQQGSGPPSLWPLSQALQRHVSLISTISSPVPQKLSITS